MNAEPPLLKMRPFDPGFTDQSKCDQCGEPAVFHAGANPPGHCLMVMDRCAAHTPSRREMDIVHRFY